LRGCSEEELIAGAARTAKPQAIEGQDALQVGEQHLDFLPLPPRAAIGVGLLASPDLVARTITAVRRENGAAEDAVLEEGDVIEALGALEPVWDELYPAEQARIMRLLIERIDVAPDGISVTLHTAGIRSLVAELADQETPALAALEPVLEAAE
jgi:hypothetical protein